MSFSTLLVSLSVGIAGLTSPTFAQALSDHDGSQLTPKSPIGEATSKVLRQTLTYPEAKEIFFGLKTDLFQRMCDPEALCYNRSQILGRELETKHQISSQKLYLYCPGSIAAINRKNGHYHRYSDHWVNVVLVQNSPREPVQKYVFDPQFTEEPKPLEDYIKLVVSDRKPVEATEGSFVPYEDHPKHSCYYRLLDRRYSLKHRQELTEAENVKWDDAELTKLREEIQEWNTKTCPKASRNIR